MKTKDWILLPAAIIGIVGFFIFFYELMSIISMGRYAELSDEQKKESKKKENWLIVGGIMLVIGFATVPFIPKNP